MKNKYGVVTISSNGDLELIGLDDYKFDLEQLHEWTSCDFIDIVRCSSANMISLVIDDCGKMLHKPINLLATWLYGNQNDCIVGDVLVCTQVSPNCNDEPDVFAFEYKLAERIYKLLAELKKELN